MISQTDLKHIIETADMVVNGFAFSIMKDGNVTAVYLRGENHASIMDSKGEVIETNMDDVELDIMKQYWMRNSKYVTEEEYA